MIRSDGTEEYPQGRPDRLRRESPDGRRAYYEGRPRQSIVSDEPVDSRSGIG